MAGLVLEGGSFRGMFSAGAMDALLDYDIHFEYVIGVSAGISNGVSYVSRQKERNIEIMRKYRNDKRYLSKRNFLRCKSLFGLDFVFDEIPNKLVPFDWDIYCQFKGVVKVGVTDAVTGETVYKDGMNKDKKFTVLRATCAIPVYFPPITIDGKEYFDGGLSDSIPIKQSIEDGNKKNLVILTQPKGYVKKDSKSAKFVDIYYRNKFPGVIKAMNNRANMYNETTKFIENVEKESSENIVVLRPNFEINSFESDIKVLEKVYRHGYEVAEQNIEKIRSLLV